MQPHGYLRLGICESDHYLLRNVHGHPNCAWIKTSIKLHCSTKANKRTSNRTCERHIMALQVPYTNDIHDFVTSLQEGMKADMEGQDRGEMVSLMEPLLIGEGSRHREALTDLALDLTQKSAGFRRSLPPSLPASLADLVRSMNCYYSNL